MGAITVFRDAAGPPYAEIVLDNGERVGLTVADGALVIRRVYDSDSPPGATLFEADAELVARICKAMSGRRWGRKSTPLQILAGVVVQIGSSVEVRAAFQAAARETAS